MNGRRYEVKPRAAVAVNLPLQKARTLAFGCGMNMLRGTLVIQ